MKYAIEINGQITAYKGIPKEWNGILNYRNPRDPDQHYNDGWRGIIEPDYNKDTQKLGRLYFDPEKDVFTYSVVALDQNEIDRAIVNSDFISAINIIRSLDDEARLSLRRAMFLNALEEMRMKECYIILDKFPGNIQKPLSDQLMVIFGKYSNWSVSAMSMRVSFPDETNGSISEPYEPNQETMPKKRINKKLLIILAIFMAVVLIVLYIWK